MDDLRGVLTVSNAQMSDWKQICRAYAKKYNADLLFVNAQSCGVQYRDTGAFHHIYIDEMQEILSKDKK